MPSTTSRPRSIDSAPWWTTCCCSPGPIRGSSSSTMEPTDLAEIALDAAGGLAQLARERGVRSKSMPTRSRRPATPARLRQLVTILVDNAIRHAPRRLHGPRPGGRRRRDGPAPRGGRGARVPARGPAPRVRPVLARARRASRRHRPRACIAAWIAERHGGTIEASNRRRAARGSRSSAAGLTPEISGDLQSRCLRTAPCTTTSHGVTSHESIRSARARPRGDR